MCIDYWRVYFDHVVKAVYTCCALCDFSEGPSIWYWLFGFLLLHVMFCCIYGCCTPEYSKQCLYPDRSSINSVVYWTCFVITSGNQRSWNWYFYWVNDMNTKTQFYIFLEYPRFIKYRSIVPVEGNRILAYVQCLQLFLRQAIKEEWDTSIVWRTSFRNEQWKLLFIDRYYLYYIW